jgi:outer membrane protein TolC
MQTRAHRIEIARTGIPAAEESFRLNWDRIENAQGLPIEVLQSIQSLALVRRKYLNVVTDYSIAQFQLWWATGWFADPPSGA